MRGRAVLVAVACGLAVAGCGSDQGASPPASTPLSASVLPAPATTPPSVPGTITTPAPPPAKPACQETSGWRTDARSSGTLSRDALYLVRAGRHACFDRVVFDINGPAAAGFAVRYTPVVTTDPKGDPLPVPGGATLQIIVRAPALGTDRSGHQPGRVPAAIGDTLVSTPAWPSLRAVRFAGSVEGLSTDVQAVARAFDVTVNDVLLAAVTGGFRELLLQRGETPAADSVRTLVPVSVRTSTALDNEVSLLLPLLPVDLTDPAQRLIRVHQRLGTLKADNEADAAALLTATAAHAPFAPVAWTIRTAAHLPQRNIVTVTTNVRGPAEPLSALGRRIVRIHPYVPIALRVRIGVAMLSYAGQVTFGITSDADTVPDTDVLAKAIERELLALANAAR